VGQVRTLLAGKFPALGAGIVEASIETSTRVRSGVLVAVRGIAARAFRQMLADPSPREELAKVF
jgi:hypothetical protein